MKDLEIIEEPTPDMVGHGVFQFSDRYSVFDWGEMPENIEGKGEVLAMMGANTFEEFEQRGIRTHYLGMEEDGEIKTLDELEGPSSRMHIELVNVLGPEFIDGSYDYSKFSDISVSNYLIPLEIIYRNRVPIGSSARERYEPRDLDLDMDSWPEEPVSLDDPIVESSTKLEKQDRYIDDEEAETMVGNASLQMVYQITRRANEIMVEKTEKAGMTHDDGKLEFLYIDGDVVIGDVAGTFDEARFTYEGKQVSKEVLRQAYKKEQSEWVEQVKEAKKEALEKGIEDWKDLVSIDPERLGIEPLVSEMYKAGANRYVGHDIFDVRSLEEVMEEIKEAIDF